MTPRRVLLVAALLWCVATVATPLLASLGGVASGAASFLYEFFSRVCHQFDSRSFHIAGHKFAVCIRCFAIYTSFLLGIVFSPLLSRTKIAAIPSSRLLVASLIPMGLDVGLATLGFHDSTAATRLITGFLFGLALSVVLVPILEEVSFSLFQQLPAVLGLASHEEQLGLLSIGDQSPDSKGRNLSSEIHLPDLCNHKPNRTSYATKT